MKNYYQVCFACRVAIRTTIHTEKNKKCPDCGQIMYALTPKLAIPKRHKVREWKALHKLVSEFPLKQAANSVEHQGEFLSYRINILKKQLEFNHPAKRQQNLINQLNQLLEEQKEYRKRTLLVYRVLGAEAFK